MDDVVGHLVNGLERSLGDGSDGPVTAVVPARAGSRGIPGKNTIMLAGKPLLAWTIEAALAARCVGRVIVSTDCPKIAQIGLDFGAEVPFLRSSELSDDNASGLAVALDALGRLEAAGRMTPWLAYLQPTSPLRTDKDIDAAFALAVEKSADSVLGVSAVTQRPSWMRQIDRHGVLQTPDNLPEACATRQAEGPLYYLNGAIYLVRSNFLIAQRRWQSSRSFGYVMPGGRALDIDEPWQLELADALLRRRHNMPAGLANSWSDEPGGYAEAG